MLWAKLISYTVLCSFMKRPLENVRPIGPLLGSSKETNYNQISEDRFDELLNDKEMVKELTLEAHQQINDIQGIRMDDLFTSTEDTMLDLVFNAGIYGECNSIIAVQRKLLPAIAGNAKNYAQDVFTNQDLDILIGQAAFPLQDYIGAMSFETGCGNKYEEEVLQRAASAVGIIKENTQANLGNPGNVSNYRDPPSIDTDSLFRFESIKEWRDYYSDFPMSNVVYNNL